MVSNLVGMGLITVLFVLVLASLAILPGESGTAARRSRPSAPRRRHSAIWFSVLSAFRVLSASRL